MMKRIVATLFFLSIALFAIALIAPGFIDWSQHKDHIIAQLKPYLGRNIEVGGQVKFRLLPNPQILLEDVTLSNAEGAKADNFMRLKQLQASMKLQPLLQGRFEIDAINLDEPELDLEILDDGSANWTGILKQREEGAGGLENAADAVQFNQITLTNGTLHYLNQVTGAGWQVDKLNATVSADTLFGPYHIIGDLQYKNAQVSLDVSTGKFGGAAVPLHIAFNPVENLPQVKFEGTIDTGGGLNARGDLAISEGNVASLFDNDFLKNIAFLSDETDVTGTVDVKPGQVKLDAIKAKFGQKGEVSGSVAIAFEKGKKPVVTADLSGSNLKISRKPGFMAVPDGFDARLKLKGKNIIWNGIHMPGVAVAIDTDKEEWVVKNGRFDLPGKSVAKIAGVITPKTRFAAYSIQVTTEDLSPMLKSLPLADDDMLKIAADSGIIKKLDWSSSLDLSPGKASFYDIDARIDDKMKVSGVLDVMRAEKASSFKAKLNLDDADMSLFAEDTWKIFTAGIMKSEGDIEIAAKNLSKGELKLAALSLDAKTAAAGLQITDMSGTFADGGEFKLSGALSGPATPMDIAYLLKASSPGAVAKAVGVSLPPPMKADAAIDVHGHIGGDAGKYTFNVDGHGLSLNGTAETGADGVETYQETLHLEGGSVFAALGLPVDRLLGAPKEISGELAGTRSDYKITKLDAGNVSGWIARKDNKYDGDLTAATLNFDDWLWSDWNVKDDIDLKLKAKKLVWRSDEVVSPELTLEAEADSVKVSGLTGQVWGGDLAAQVEGHKKGDAWTGTLKGSAKGVDLGQLAALMEFKGFSVGSGDLDFDLQSDGKKEEKEWFHGVGGALNVKTSALTVKSFAPGSLFELLDSFKKQPEDLPQEVVKSLNSGDTTYSNVDAAFKVADGKINIEKLNLADAAAAVDVKGAYEFAPETFHITAEMKLKSPSDAPAFTLSRSGDMKNAPGYTVNVKPLQDYLARRMAKDETKPVPEAPMPQPETQPQPEPKPKPEQPQPATPDDNHAVQLGPEEPAPPPSLPTPADTGDGGSIDTPIETEPLEAPAPPPPPVQLTPSLAPPPPATPAPPPAPAQNSDHAAIKGILDRLNDTAEPKPGNTMEELGPPPDKAPDEVLP